MKVVNLNKLSEPDKSDLISRITMAANSQNPTNTRDLRSVDKIQKILEQEFKNIGYQYIRRRGVRIKRTDKTIFMKDLAQAYESFYMDQPYTAYSRVYEEVFPKAILDGKEQENGYFKKRKIAVLEENQYISNTN